MHICHVSPHLPPDQAANALLPLHLGEWARAEGYEVSYVAHPPRAAGNAHLPGPVRWPRATRNHGPALRAARVASLFAAIGILRHLLPAIRSADLVHVHSNGLLSELAVLTAARRRKPTVLTLYGTEIWHYRPKRIGPDLFTRAYRTASAVTFYSQGLSARAQEIGLARRETSVIYPPVAAAFEWSDVAAQHDARARLGLRNRHLIVNVKRLHPLAGQRFLIEAMGEVVRKHPDTRLVICGTGPLLGELRAVARASGVEGHVTFAGLLDNAMVAQYCMAADAFALPSVLEACPTVALEALACGTPVIAADSPGGVELNDLFGIDVAVVPREHPMALAGALMEFIENKRRARPQTADLIEREFRPAAVWARFQDTYSRAIDLETARVP
jgi:glycosyltransferase involved in cell wall biosynthesis